jgi:hypothetical protein
MKSGATLASGGNGPPDQRFHLAAAARVHIPAAMWRAHFVVLGDLPARENLARLDDGYQLFRESRTGLHYLTAWASPPRRRPDFGGFLERGTGNRIDLAPLERLLAGVSRFGAVKRHEVSLDLIQRAASLSRQLEMAVLVAEVTDDDYAMAVMAERGVLRYLRFRTELQDQGAGATLAEVTYGPEAGIGIDAAPNDAIHGLAQRAIRDLFRVEGVDLDKYCEQHPPRSAGDSYGLFTRLGGAPPRLSLAARLLAPLRFAGAFLTIPFILAGTVLIALVYSGRPGQGPALTIWRLFLLGFTALAVPVALLVLILRGLFG